MKFSLLSENLQKKLLFVNHAISTRAQLPTLLNFLIEAKKGKLSISATDLEIGIIMDVPAKIEKDGSVMVSAKILTELIGTFPLGKIGFETSEGGVKLVGEKTTTIFQTIPAEEFPKLYEEKGKQILTLKKETIAKDFSRVVFAASPDSERPALSGILIKEREDGFILVATDGYRLSLKEHALKNVRKSKIEEPVSILVPSRVIKELLQMEKDVEGGDVDVYVSVEKNQIIFLQNDTTLIGRLIEAEFPSYEKIIPQDFSTKTIFQREEMQRAIKAGYVFARQTAGIIKISIKTNKIIVSANAPSVGQNSVEVEAKTTGEENDIAFNARYLLEFLANTSDEDVSFEMTGPLNPGVFREQDDPSFLHLIMPIRVQQDSA